MIPYVIICFLIAIIGFMAYRFEKYKNDIENKHKLDISVARQDALNKSRSTINGYVTETLAPLLPGFPYNGRDATHVGSPLDFIIFNGMSEYRDNGTGEIEIVLIDVKTGNAQLTPVEKAIKEACDEKRVRWETLRMDLDRGGLVPVKHRKKKVVETIDEPIILE